MNQHEAGMLSDPIVWYTLALLIFFVVAYFKIRQPVLSWLDSEIAKVRGELDQAKKLRAEAEISLSDYRAKQKEALQEAEAIIVHAKEEAAQLRVSAEADLKTTLQRREQQALERIRLAEVEALAEVRQAVVEQAVAEARKIMSAQADAATAEKWADQAIAEIASLTGKNAKAA